jgi:UDP-2,3-diacylglucosamine hydrolase
MAAPAAPAPAPFGEFVAPAHWRTIDFLSDLHLAAEMPRTFDAWAAHLECTPADAVFMLGDLFEVWVGDDARHEGFERRCADVLRAAAQQRTLAFLAGNRDFLVGDALLSACDVVSLADPTVVAAFGARTLVTHGDALCVDDVDYQRFRAEVRSDAWCERFLARPLSERRAIARSLRDASEQRRRSAPVPDAVDVDASLAAQWLARAEAGTMVHGHTHRPGRHALPGGTTRWVLSDWDLDTAANPRADVLRWTADGLTRVPPATP